MGIIERNAAIVGPSARIERSPHKSILSLVEVGSSPVATADGARAIRAACSILRAGQSLELGITVCGQGRRTAALRASIAIPSADDAQLRLLECALRMGAPAYRFARTRREGTKPAAARAISLSPVCQTWPSTRIGFLESNDTDIESLPGTGAFQRRDPQDAAGSGSELADAIRSLQLARIDARIDVKISAFEIPPRLVADRQALRTMVGDRKLADWLADPRGFRLSCIVKSAETIPGSTLQALGRGVFGTSLVAIADPSDPGAAEPPTPSTCRHHTEDLPTLMPPPGLLRESGVARSWPFAPAGLPQRGVPIGSAVFASGETTVRLPDTQRDRHLYLIGATGTGKSSLLRSLIAHDIDHGAGVMLIDPHGDLHREVLAVIPPSRAADVIVIDASDCESAVGLNLLITDGRPVDIAATRIANELLAMLDMLYDMRVAGGPIFESYLRHSIALLMHAAPGITTLVDLPRLFEDDGFRRALLARCEAHDVNRFWRRTASETSGDHSWANMTSYVTSKVGRFVHDAALRPMIGQRNRCLDLRRAMDEGRIVLVNLAKGALTDTTARFLGMLVLSRLSAAAFGRADIPREERRPFHVYADEFQTLANAGTIELIAEARKFGIRLTLASQTLSQLTGDGPELRDVILGNIGSLLMFRLGPEDANRLGAFINGAVSAEEVQSLPNFHAVARVMTASAPLPTFVVKTKRHGSRRGTDPQAIIERSRALHGMPRPLALELCDASPFGSAHHG